MSYSFFQRKPAQELTDHRISGKILPLQEEKEAATDHEALEGACGDQSIGMRHDLAGPDTLLDQGPEMFFPLSKQLLDHRPQLRVLQPFQGT